MYRSDPELLVVEMLQINIRIVLVTTNVSLVSLDEDFKNLKGENCDASNPT